MILLLTEVINAFLTVNLSYSNWNQVKKITATVKARKKQAKKKVVSFMKETMVNISYIELLEKNIVSAGMPV